MAPPSVDAVQAYSHATLLVSRVMPMLGIEHVALRDRIIDLVALGIHHEGMGHAHKILETVVTEQVRARLVALEKAIAASRTPNEECKEGTVKEHG